MSLNWKHSDHNRADWVALDDDTATSIIFRTMAVGINKITADNVEEFYIRNAMLDRAGLREPFLTLKDCAAAIGLQTNASTETNFQFGKKVAQVVRDNSEYSLRNESK